MSRIAKSALLMRLPLILLIWAVASLAMYVPAGFALVQDDHASARAFFYSGTLGLLLVLLTALALGNRGQRNDSLGQLLSLMATFVVLPAFLAVPLHDALRTTSFLNAYFDMVSAITTTGANLFRDPDRLAPALHLWRALVGWMGGLLMWISASAILAPLFLGGFEVTAQGAPGRRTRGPELSLQSNPRQRLLRVARVLVPIYVVLTGVAWVLQMIAGEDGLTGLCHAMSVMATSGISPVGGVQGGQAGFGGELVLFVFMFFALSRLTFSNDTVSQGQGRLDRDPEFLAGLLFVLGIPLLLFLRHWVGASEVADMTLTQAAFRAFWGSIFTVLSFLSTTGFVSADWLTVQSWSGLSTPGLVLMGLAVMGGGVATTAGGVKLLRVYALYLSGLLEMQRLVHPSSVSGAAGRHKRIQRDGAFIAWIFFMMFAMSLAVITVSLAAMGVEFEPAIILSIATLSTTGPLTEVAGDAPIRLAELSAAAKGILCAAMVLGRLETLAIVALLSPDLWRR